MLTGIQIYFFFNYFLKLTIFLFAYKVERICYKKTYVF